MQIGTIAESNIGGIGVEERVVLHSGLKANL